MDIFFKLIISPILTLLIVFIIGSATGPIGWGLALLSSPVIWFAMINWYDKWEDAKYEQEQAAKERKEKEKDEKRKQEREEAEEKEKKEIEKQKKKEIDDLTKSFGSKFSEDIFKMVYKKGMTKDMIKEIDRRNDTSPAYKFEEDEIEEWYYTNSLLPYLGFDFKTSFKDNKVTDIPELEDGIWIDMTKEILEKACGQPADIKKNVGRDLVKEKWYYGERETRQGTTVFKREVRLVNGIVDGWSELE